MYIRVAKQEEGWYCALPWADKEIIRINARPFLKTCGMEVSRFTRMSVLQYSGLIAI
jgi:hypothetical protein